MANVTIDVIGMSDVVRGLEQGIATLGSTKSSLYATLDRFSMDTSQTVTIGLSVTWAVDALPGVRRRYAKAQTLEGTDPSWSPGTAVFDEDTISTLAPELALAYGKEAAATLLDGDGEPDEELIAQLEANMEDPYFASGFASAVTPDELAAIVLRLSGARAPADGRLDADALVERNAWYGRVVSAMGTTLATATRATGDLALPSGYGQSWVNEITAEVSNAQTPDGTGQADHANALGLLLGSGKYSTVFLGTVSEGVYDYERSYQEEHRGAVWAPRSGDPSTGYVVYDANGQVFRDPMAGVMSALGNNPVAAQSFFSRGDTVTVKINGVDREVSDRLQYLVQDRTWASDPSNGASLGSALEAATTTYRDQTVTGRTSAEIASQTFALIGEQTDGGGWKMWDGLRPSVATMLASYGADVFRVASSGQSDDLAAEGWSMPDSGAQFADDMPYGATLDKELLERIVGTLGEDQENFTPFLTGMFQAGNLAMDTGLQRALVQQTETHAGALFLTGAVVDDSSSSITSSAKVVGWALDTGYGGDTADEAEKKKRAESIADALSLAAGLPFVPEIKPEWVSWGVDQGKDQALDAIKESAPSDSGATYQALDIQARASLRDNVANLLLRNGYLSDEAIAAAKADGKIIAPPPAEAIYISPTGEKSFLTDSPEYKYWLSNSALQTRLEESVVGVYADQWGIQ